MRRLFTFSAILFWALSACQDASPQPQPIEVEHRGALKEIMHQGRLESRIDLDSLKREHLYALGAAEGLKGEILVWDGEAILAQAQDSLRSKQSTGDSARAALLVYSYVENWHCSALPDSIYLQSFLEDYLPVAAAAQGIDTSAPFPFLLRGAVSRASWHVVDWPLGDTVHSHEKHQRSGAWGIIEGLELDILGFYSQKHRSIFTHHSSAVHMHFRSQNGALAGHLDKLLPGPAMELCLPRP